MATRWRLITCKCVLVYDSVDDKDRFTNPIVEHDCGAHGAELDAPTHFARVLSYMRAANAALPQGG